MWAARAAALLALLAVHRLPGAPLPVLFEANGGRLDPEVQFLARAEGQTLLFRPAAIEFVPGAAEGPSSVRLSFSGAAPCRWEPEGDRIGVSYLRGKDPRRWRWSLAAYPQLRCRDLYPGVDLRFHSGAGRLEYDIIIAAGADPAALELRLEGMTAVKIDPAGALQIETPAGRITHHPPVAWQELSNGGRMKVEARYALRGPHRVAIILGDYRPANALVIDPVVSFSTFLGGASLDEARGVAVDAEGNVILAGTTQSADFPVTAPGAPPSAQFPGDVFVAKLAPDGASLRWAVYIGGARTDVATGVAVDGADNVYVAGHTDSLDFPATSGAFRTNAPGNGIEPDGFVLKLNPQGSALLYSTYVGGISTDRIHALAVDRDGNAYLAGTTDSDNFPATQGAFRSRRCAGFGLDGFVAKLNAAGSGLAYMTFLCGSSHEEVLGLAVDGQGSAVAAGYTMSADFPATAGALSRERRGAMDGFVARISPNGSALAYSSFVGGSAEDVASAVSLDAAGRIYVAGYTRSRDLPVTPVAFQPRHADNGLYEDAFVMLFSPAGGELVRSTYLGGSATDRAHAVVVDASGTVLVAGHSSSTDFRASPAPCETGYSGRRDAFVARVDLERGTLPEALLLGGRGDDEAFAVAALPGAATVVAGLTRSANFPTTAGAWRTSYQRGYQGGGDAFIARVEFGRSAATPCLAHGGVVNAASSLPGPVAPGEIVSLFGAGLGPETSVSFVLGEDLRVPTELAGTRVLFDGLPAPVLAASSGQVNAIVPFGVDGRSETRLEVEYRGKRTTQVRIPVAPAAPAIFTLNQTGGGPGAILNEDYSVNSPENPARRGSVIQIFATGGGQTTPAGVDGRVVLPVFGPIPLQRAPVAVTIGGLAAPVLYAGAAPELVAGVVQVNARIPEGVAPGSAVPIILEAAGTASPATVTVAVR